MKNHLEGCTSYKFPAILGLHQHGANPNDDESLYHATELGHTEGLKLLMQHGVSTRGTNALPRALDFGDVEAVRLLLEYGADPNETVAGHPSGQAVDSIPALHQAARRFCSAEIGALLLDYGADSGIMWEGHTGEVLKLLGICRRCILRGDSSSTGFSL